MTENLADRDGYERIKICYLSSAISVHTQRWVQYFADIGHEVHLITLTPLDNDNLQNVKLYPLKVARELGGVEIPMAMRRVNLPYVIFQIKSLIKRIKPDILHAHSVTDNGVFGTLCGFHPFVVTAWGSDILIASKQSIFLKLAAQFVLKQADSITCDAEHMIKSMMELGAPKEKIDLIFFGTDVQKFSPAQRDEKFKEKLNLKLDDSPTIISLRNLSPVYDVESLIRAVPRVLQEVSETKFIIAGHGEQRSYLEELTASLGVADSIKFVGLIPSDELPCYLASADVYVSTSLSDAGLAASTAEAMASELPVVITDFGNNGDWVKDGEGGFLVPLKDPTTLAEKIIYLLKNEDVRKKFGRVNRKVIVERNNYYKQMAKVEHIYQRLIKEHRI